MKFDNSKLLNILIAALLILLMIPAECQRILTDKMGVIYWVLAIPSFGAVYFIYKVIAGDMMKEERKRMLETEKETGITDRTALNSQFFRMMSISCVIYAAIAFFVSIVIRLLFAA